MNSLFNRAVGELCTWSSWRRRRHARRLLLHRRRHCQLGGHLGLLVGSILTAGRIGLNNFFAIYWKSESCCQLYFIVHIFKIVSLYVHVVLKKRTFRIIILQADTSERSDSRRLESDLSEVSDMPKMQILSSGVSLKGSCKMLFRSAVLRSIGPSSQML